MSPFVWSRKWLLVAVAGLILATTLAGCKVNPPTPPVTPTPTTVPTEAPTPIPPSPTPISLEGAKTTESGLQYLEIKPGTGDLPKKGQIVKLNYNASLPDGTQLADTFTENAPISIVWGVEPLLPGWEEGIGLTKVGGRTKLLLPPSLAFGEAGAGSIPPNSQVVMEIEILEVKDAPVPTAVAEEKLTKTASGLQYYDLVAGDGTEATKNSSVATHYTIWVKTDTGYNFVYQSEPDKPITFVVGRGDVVFPGWDEGVTGMKVGGKRYLVIPPALGMGDQGSQVIPADATVVMEIELTKVTEPRVATKVDEKDYTTTASGLKYYDLVPGTGDTPKTGDTVVVQYTGWLEDGTQFDSSIDRGEPFSFTLGTGGVIPGWDEGVATMKVGGKRQLVVPAALGYGDQGAGNLIPPGATLIFEVELVSITPAGK